MEQLQSCFSSHSIITCCIILLSYVHVFIFYEILLPRRICSTGNNVYNIFLGMWHLMAYGTVPPLLMLVFSLLTVRHVHQRQIMRIANVSNQIAHSTSKDRHLLRVVLAQCLLFAIAQWYITFTTNQTKSSLQQHEKAYFIIQLNVFQVSVTKAHFLYLP